jgi:hypothetical protein
MDAVCGHEVANKCMVVTVVWKMSTLAETVERLFAPRRISGMIVCAKVAEIKHPRL